MSALLARLSGLTVAYRADGQPTAALEAVDLDIVAGERLAIIGESGSGKSTLALALAGLLPDNATVDRPDRHGRCLATRRSPAATSASCSRTPAPASTRC